VTLDDTRGAMSGTSASLVQEVSVQITASERMNCFMLKD